MCQTLPHLDRSFKQSWQPFKQKNLERWCVWCTDWVFLATSSVVVRKVEDEAREEASLWEEVASFSLSLCIYMNHALKLRTLTPLYSSFPFLFFFFEGRVPFLLLGFFDLFRGVLESFWSMGSVSISGFGLLWTVAYHMVVSFLNFSSNFSLVKIDHNILSTLNSF